ncbi:MAG: regulator of cell autolysis [Bacteroidetes bacterium HGW-Bacteroidetes-2]|jgi:tetratricopeptide (TPR) repeat protein|nr:MAG: regulator of cell autolysis [Bacteroidetes bacterium HGW-Bacteroidetes-2]
MKQTLCFLFLIFYLPWTAFSQDTTKNAQTPLSLSKKAKEVQKSLQDDNPEATAIGYENLAKELIEKGDLVRAESYLISALDIYKKEKNNEKIISLTRTLAQVQENQQKFGEAISNYQTAGEVSQGNPTSKINLNDAKRVSNRSNSDVEMGYIESNIQLLEKEGKVEDVVNVYKQRAEANLKAEDKERAIESYSRAIEVAKEKPEDILKLKTEIAKIYASDNQLDKAIAITNNALEDAKILNDIPQQIKQKQALAGLYLQKKNGEEAEKLLKEAYKSAMENARTFDAKEAMIALSALYKSRGDATKSFEAYDLFFADFERLIKADSSLVDAKIFEVTEERIRQLEKEKALKDEILTKKTRYNSVLIGSILLMLLLLSFIIKTLFSIQNKNKRIALQSLRREMNPHFIFNSLNSVNQFISQNKELEANKYLTSYSNLMRNMMETSNSDFITLSNELEQIKKYLHLEHLRFQDKFDYEIVVDETLDPETIWIPNMLLQPHLENAIWHGLRYKDEKGSLKISFLKENKRIKVCIEDDGIGIEKSKTLKTQNQKIHISRGLNNVKERIQLLNDLYKQKIQLEIQTGTKGIGTKVELYFLLWNSISYIKKHL